MAVSVFDACGDNDHQQFAAAMFPPKAFYRRLKGWFLGGRGRYGTTKENLERQARLIEELLDLLERMTTTSVARDNWRAYCLEWTVLQETALRHLAVTKKARFGRKARTESGNLSNNYITLDIIKLLTFPGDRDVYRKSEATTDEATETETETENAQAGFRHPKGTCHCRPPLCARQSWLVKPRRVSRFSNPGSKTLTCCNRFCAFYWRRAGTLTRSRVTLGATGKTSAR